MTLTTLYKIVKKAHWGSGHAYEKWIVNNEKYCGKVLYFYDKDKTSFHYHKLKDEVMYVRQGKAKIYYAWNDDFVEGQFKILDVDESFHIPAGLRHRIENVGDGLLELFEFSTQHFDSDSYRVPTGNDNPIPEVEKVELELELPNDLDLGQPELSVG